MREWSAKNRQKTRDFAKACYRGRQDTDPEWRDKERERNRIRRPAPVTTPEKNRARGRLAYALLSGKIVKPEACSVCHEKVTRKRLHGHHSDHTKPLDVTWLCTVCHGLEHRVA